MLSVWGYNRSNPSYQGCAASLWFRYGLYFLCGVADHVCVGRNAVRLYFDFSAILILEMAAFDFSDEAVHLIDGIFFAVIVSSRLFEFYDDK